MSALSMKEISAPKAKVYVLNPDGTQPLEMVQITSLKYEQVLNDVGQLRMSVLLTPQSQGAFIDVHPDASVPIVVQVAGMETVWFATHVEEEYGDAAPQINVIAVSPEKFLEAMYCWPNPLAPPEAQVSKRDIAVGPIAHIVKKQILRPNLARLTVRTLGGSVHHVAPVTKRDDYTRHTIIQMKMDQSLELIKSLLDPEGLTLTCRLYVPGRGDEPPKLHNPKKACLVWDVVQRAQLPSGGLFILGILKTQADFWKDVWNTITDYSLKGVGASSEAVDYWGKPQLMVRKHQYDSLLVETVKPTASVYTVGGNSPEWLNKMLATGLGTLMNMAAGPLGIFLDTSALNNVLDDRFMAYHSFTDFARLKRMGPFGMMETFKPSTGLSVDAVMMLKQQQYKTRATRSHEFTLSPSAGMVPGRDFEIGSMLALELPGDRYVVAFVQAIKYEWTNKSAPEVTVQVSDRPRRDPFEGLLRQFSSIAALVNKVALAE